MAGRHERSTEAAAVLRAVMDAHPEQLYVKRLAELVGCDDSHIRHCLAGNRTIGVELLCAAFAVTRERALLNLILGDVRAEVRFGVSARQITNWFATAFAQMRDAMGDVL